MNGFVIHRVFAGTIVWFSNHHQKTNPIKTLSKDKILLNLDKIKFTRSIYGLNLMVKFIKKGFFRLGFRPLVSS